MEQTACAKDTYKAAHTVNYGSTSSCTSCANGYTTGNKTGSGSCYSICQFDDGNGQNDELLFGTSKGDPAGNYGDYYSSFSWGGYECVEDKVKVMVYNGYDRKCVYDACGRYKGKTANYLNNTFGCAYANYWCSTSNTSKNAAAW